MLGLVIASCGGDDSDESDDVADESGDDVAEDVDPTSPTTDPQTTDPETTDPETTDPQTTDPETTDPETTDPQTTDPETTDPETTDPETTDPPKPTQRISVVDLDGRRVELTGDTVLPTNQTLIVHDLVPTAPDTQVAVQIRDVGPANVCSSDSGPAAIFLQGNAGDVCDVVISVDGTADFAATTVTVGIEFVSLANIGWTIESGPPGTGCFSPGDRLPDLVLRAASGTDSIFGVGVLRSYFIDPAGNRDDSTFGRLDIQEPLGDEFTTLTIEFSVDPTVPPGSVIGVVVGYSSPGTGVSTSDEPDEFEWRIENPCP